MHLWNSNQLSELMKINFSAIFQFITLLGSKIVSTPVHFDK